jgi:hypothetical protein
MDQDLHRIAHRALQEAPSRGNSFLSASDWAVSRIRSQRPGMSVADVRKAVAVEDLKNLSGCHDNVKCQATT